MCYYTLYIHFVCGFVWHILFIVVRIFVVSSDVLSTPVMFNLTLVVMEILEVNDTVLWCCAQVSR